jgi:hypothetical protein
VQLKKLMHKFAPAQLGKCSRCSQDVRASPRTLARDADAVVQPVRRVGMVKHYAVR